MSIRDDVKLTEAQINAAGLNLAKALKLKRDKEHKDRWQTEWGTKTNTGLYLTLKHQIQQIENGKSFLTEL